MIALILTALMAGTQAPPPDASNVPADPRVQTIAYDPGRVVSLKAAANFQVTVLFTGEQIENVAIGDSDAWQATLNGTGDALFIKPLRTGSATNMTVITDARVYSFELSTTFGPVSDAPYIIRFAAPEGAGAGIAGQPRPGTGRYRLSGARSLRPVSIDDDGRSTFVVWSANQPIPAVFAVDERGDEILIDGRVRQGRFVIDGVYPRLIFRVGRDTAGASRQRAAP